MSFIRSLMAGLGGIGGFMAWYLAMRATGLWSSFLAALYSEHDRTVVGFVGSLLLSGFGSGALALFVGERLRLFPSREQLDRQAKPPSLFSGQDSPARLNLTNPPAPVRATTSSPKAQPASPTKSALNATPDLSKPYVRFQNPNGAPSFLAHPVKFLPGLYNQNAIQPGSHDSLGNPGIWANDTAAQGFADWTDGPDAGLFSRNLCVVDDALGAKGRIGGMPYAVRAVLQIGQNVVIYQLDNLDTGEYIVLGFPIELVDAVGAMARYLRRVAEEKEQLSTVALGSMADRILERFPTNDAALFNKGVALIAEEDFAEAHGYFERALSHNGNDQLTILYDAAALAGMGQHKRAMQQFAKADSISEEWVCENIGLVGILPKYLSVSVSELMRADPEHQRYTDLWSKYFSSIEI